MKAGDPNVTIRQLRNEHYKLRLEARETKAEAARDVGTSVRTLTRTLERERITYKKHPKSRLNLDGQPVVDPPDDAETNTDD